MGSYLSEGSGGRNGGVQATHRTLQAEGRQRFQLRRNRNGEASTLKKETSRLDQETDTLTRPQGWSQKGFIHLPEYFRAKGTSPEKRENLLSSEFRGANGGTLKKPVEKKKSLTGYFNRSENPKHHQIPKRAQFTFRE